MWNMAKSDVKHHKAGDKDLPLEWQIEYGSRFKGKWARAAWDGNREGTIRPGWHCHFTRSLTFID